MWERRQHAIVPPDLCVDAGWQSDECSRQISSPVLDAHLECENEHGKCHASRIVVPVLMNRNERRLPVERAEYAPEGLPCVRHVPHRVCDAI
eukprot:7391886-Prymnesium_polylepis.1